MSATPPSVLLVEDHGVMGRMLARFLQEQGKIEVWAVAETAEAALKQLAVADARQPDLVLVDVSLPGMSGIDLLAELGRLYSTLPCLMLSAHRDLHYVRQALKNGARGYVTKGDAPAILEAVQRVLKGERYLSEAVRQELDS